MLKDTLRRHGIQLDRQKGQHFLEDQDVLQRMVDEAEITAEDTVLEIGTGIGTLTRILADNAGQVITYELDDGLIPAVQEELADYDNIDLRNEDVLNADIPEFDKCVANLPFQISSPVMELLGAHEKPAVIMVQKAFADRLVAKPGDKNYSRITVFTNYHFIPVYLMDVPRTLFTPPPEVDAAVVKLFPREKQFGITDETAFFALVRALFIHSKKKTRNAFYDSRHLLEMDKQTAKQLRDRIPHSEKRVRELSMRDLAEIVDALRST